MERLHNLFDIFSQKILRIPDYQRGYAWVERQRTDFWDDILNLVERRKHYTGMISLKKMTDKECEKLTDEQWALKNYDAYHVVDGQQRLTTFVILLASILDEVRNLSKNKGKSDRDIAFASVRLDTIVEHFIVQTNAEYDYEKIYKFGYDGDEASSKFLKKEIFNDKTIFDTLENSVYTLNLKDAKEFFSYKLKSLKNDDESSYEKMLATLYSRITQDLVFVVQEIDGEIFDVFVAFETMNNRGLLLSNLEKLKNRLIYLTTLYSADELPIERYQLLRNDINKAWKTVYEQLGRNSNNKLEDDDFLKNHWTLYFRYSRQTGTEYVDDLLSKTFISRRVLVKDENHITPQYIRDYVSDLAKMSVIWFYTYNPRLWNELSDNEVTYLEKLNRIEMAYFRPVIVSAYMNNSIDAEQRYELLKAIERYVFISFRMLGFRTQNDQSYYLRMARDLKEKRINVNELITDLDNKATKYAEKYMESGFIAKIDHLFDADNGFYSWEGIRYFLYEYELSLPNHYGVPKIVAENFFKKNETDKYSIEHIYPQTHDTVWSWANGYRFFNDSQKMVLCNSLGNLLPLSTSINAQMQNYPYIVKRDGSKDSKRQGYKNGSFSELEIVNHNNGSDEWTFNDIKERGIQLLKFMEKRWGITLGDDEKKIQILHLDFLSTVDFSVDEIPEFKDVVSVVRKNSVKGNTREFWVLLNNKLLEANEGYHYEENEIPTGGNFWVKKKLEARTELYFDLDKESIELVLYIPKSEVYDELIKIKEDLDTAIGINSDWVNKSNASSYHKVILARKEFDLANRDVWKDVINEFAEKMYDCYYIINNAIEKLDVQKTKSSSQKLTEEEFLDQYSNRTPSIDLYNQLKEHLFNIYNDISCYFTNNYVAFNSTQNFAELHIQSNGLSILVKDTGIQSELGNHLPDSFNWTLNYRFKITTEEQLEEAIKLIDASYDSVK